MLDSGESQREVIQPEVIWLERLTVWGIMFLILRQGIARYEVYFDEHNATQRALRLAAILAKLLPVRFYPAGLCLNQKDENGFALEYSRIDNHCAIVDKFCENHMRGDPAWLINMTKCFISSGQFMERIAFITIVLNRIKGVESGEQLIYLQGNYLNYLLEDFFKPQIKVKSLPSIAALLRLVVTPFTMMIRTGVQQLFHYEVKGNIRENQKIPAFWIELPPKSFIGNQLREFIATNSAGRTYDIVYYLDRLDTPPIPETVGELEKQGFGWIDTRKMLHAQLSAADYFRLMAGFWGSLRRRQFWLALYLFHFEIRRTLYLSQYKRFNVRLLLQHQEGSWIQEAQRQAIESAGGIMVGLHYSNYPDTQYPDLLTCQHVMFVWGASHYEFYKIKGNTCSYILPVGLWITGSDVKTEDVTPPQKGNFTLAIFDSSVEHFLYQSAENLSKFYLEIFSILEDNPSFSGIIKSKSLRLAELRHLPAGEEIVSHITSLEQQGRLRLLDRATPPVDAAQVADLSVCFGLNSAGIITGLLGRRAVHWDCVGWLKYPVYRDKDQKILFATLAETRQAVLRAAAGDNTIGDFNKWRQWINHFDGCAGGERIMRFINLYMQEAGGSIGGLDSAIKQYWAHLDEADLVSWRARTLSAKNDWS